MLKPHTNNKIAAWNSDAVEARIVELSLQNPEFSAKHLLRLLAQEEIDVSISSVYNILKRHGLQNRKNRLERIKVKQAVEALRLHSEKTPSIRHEQAEKVPPPRYVLPVSKAHARIGVSGSWALTAVNVVLLVLLAY
jgi:hypothetical protein